MVKKSPESQILTALRHEIGHTDLDAQRKKAGSFAIAAALDPLDLGNLEDNIRQQEGAFVELEQKLGANGGVVIEFYLDYSGTDEVGQKRDNYTDPEYIPEDD